MGFATPHHISYRLNAQFIASALFLTTKYIAKFVSIRQKPTLEKPSEEEINEFCKMIHTEVGNSDTPLAGNLAILVIQYFKEQIQSPDKNIAIGKQVPWCIQEQFREGLLKALQGISPPVED